MRNMWHISVFILLFLFKSVLAAGAVMQAPLIDFGLSESTEYRQLNLKVSQTTDKALYCSSFQFRLAAAVFAEGASDSSDLLCGHRMLNDIYAAQIRYFSINPVETLHFRDLDSNFFSELIRLRLEKDEGKAYFQTLSGGTFVVGEGNAPYFSDDESAQSGRLSFCPRPLDFQTVCSPGCAPGERLVNGSCERHIIQNMALAGNAACALNPVGSVKCWGERPLTPSNDTPSFQTLLGSGNEMCGLTGEGQLRCWGQPGSSTSISAQMRWKSFAMASSRSCGVTAQGQILCFGVNSRIPVAVEDREDWKSVAVSDRETCAIDNDGAMECWRNGSLKTHSLKGKTLLAVSGGKKHFCAKVDDEKLSCWGETSGPETAVPVELGPVKSFSVGNQHNCAIDQNDKLWCWGANESQQLDFPPTMGPVRAVSAGFKSTCALTDVGRFTCWGQSAGGINTIHPDL